MPTSLQKLFFWFLKTFQLFKGMALVRWLWRSVIVTILVVEVHCPPPNRAPPSDSNNAKDQAGQQQQLNQQIPGQDGQPPPRPVSLCCLFSCYS